MAEQLFSIVFSNMIGVDYIISNADDALESGGDDHFR